MKYNETDLFVIYNMRHLVSRASIPIDNELKSYLDVYFTQTTNDWVKNVGFNTQTVKRYEARECELADFGTYHNAKTLWDIWAGF